LATCGAAVPLPEVLRGIVADQAKDDRADGELYSNDGDSDDAMDSDDADFIDDEEQQDDDGEAHAQQLYHMQENTGGDSGTAGTAGPRSQPPWGQRNASDAPGAPDAPGFPFTGAPPALPFFGAPGLSGGTPFVALPTAPGAPLAPHVAREPPPGTGFPVPANAHELGLLSVSCVAGDGNCFYRAIAHDITAMQNVLQRDVHLWAFGQDGRIVPHQEHGRQFPALRPVNLFYRFQRDTQGQITDAQGHYDAFNHVHPRTDLPAEPPQPRRIIHATMINVVLAEGSACT